MSIPEYLSRERERGKWLVSMLKQTSTSNNTTEVRYTAKPKGQSK